MLETNKQLKVTTLDGAIEFDHFTHKDTNMVKLRLVGADGDAEGIWISIQDQDMPDYKADVHDTHYHRVGVLANPSLHGIPWGTYIPYRLQGGSRPVCYLRHLTGDMVFCEATQQALAEKSIETVFSAQEGL